MKFPIFSLRISEDCKVFLNSVKNDYGANGVNRLIEAIYKFCTTGQSEIDGINVRQFFDDAISGRLIEAGSRKSKLAAADNEIYLRYAAFLTGEYGRMNILPLICNYNTAEEFFTNFPQFLNVLQEEFFNECDCPIRISEVKRYTARWYREMKEDGTADEFLKQDILRKQRMRYTGEEQ